jgi:hypothetical protein
MPGLANLDGACPAIGRAYSGFPAILQCVRPTVRILADFALQWSGEGHMVAWMGATIVGWLGWWLGSFVGPMTAFLVSAVGTAVGLYYSRRLLDDLTG